MGLNLEMRTPRVPLLSGYVWRFLLYSSEFIQEVSGLSPHLLLQLRKVDQQRVNKRTLQHQVRMVVKGHEKVPWALAARPDRLSLILGTHMTEWKN